MSGTVLIVEDEPELREMMHEVLSFGGYSVVTAMDGEDALQVLPHIKDCCVILLDLLMPRMDGWTFVEKLRAEPSLSNIPVIVHSSSPKKAPPTVTKVLQKPVEVDRLLSAVRECCGSA